jgi:excisionase family DNA binding protein
VELRRKMERIEEEAEQDEGDAPDVAVGEDAGVARPRARRQTRQRHRPETRAQMLERLSNPLISLHEAGVLLRVCAATVRRLSNDGELPHERTEGGQRRFRLREVLRVLAEREARRRSPGRSPSGPLAPALPATRPLPAHPSRVPAASSGSSRQAASHQAPAHQAARQVPERDPREVLAATRARAQAVLNAAPKHAAPKEAVPPITPIGIPSGKDAARPSVPLRLNAVRARAAKATLPEGGAEGDGEEGES